MLEAYCLDEKEHHLTDTTESMVAAGVAVVLLGHPSMGCSASGGLEGLRQDKRDRNMTSICQGYC